MTTNNESSAASAERRTTCCGIVPPDVPACANCPADDVAARDRARLRWHRQCGLDGSRCPTERDCEVFNLGFEAALLYKAASSAPSAEQHTADEITSEQVAEQMHFAFRQAELLEEQGVHDVTAKVLRDAARMLGALQKAASDTGRQIAKERIARLREQQSAPSSEALKAEGYVATVPDQCDRIVWRGRYHHLGSTTEQTTMADVIAWADGVTGDLGTEYASRVTESEAKIAQAILAISSPSAAPAAALTEDSEIKAALHHLAEPGEVINTEWISRLLRRQLAPSAIGATRDEAAAQIAASAAVAAKAWLESGAKLPILPPTADEAFRAGAAWAMSNK